MSLQIINRGVDVVCRCRKWIIWSEAITDRRNRVTTSSEIVVELRQLFARSGAPRPSVNGDDKRRSGAGFHCSRVDERTIEVELELLVVPFRVVQSLEIDL